MCTCVRRIIPPNSFAVACSNKSIITSTRLELSSHRAVAVANICLRHLHRSVFTGPETCKPSYVRCVAIFGSSISSYVCRRDTYVFLALLLPPALSHNATSVRDTTQEVLRDIMSARTKPLPPRRAKNGTRRRKALGVEINNGNTVFTYAKNFIGEKAMSHIVQSGEKFRLPKNFWTSCCRHCFDRVCTPALQKSLRNALMLYIETLRKGR